MKQLLTHSRQDAFKTCRKRHYFAYELGLRRIDDAKALRMGSAFHEGIESLGKGLGLVAACQAVRSKYTRCPVFMNPAEWSYERETVLRLVCAYDWRWASHPLENVAVELPFELPLVNPSTGKRTTLFNLAGKIDGIVKMEDGRLAVKESKLLGDDIGHDSDLWRRLRIDHQISLYMVAARQLGYPVQTVLYDVTRKPTIAATDVPVLDELGAKIVLNEFGTRVKTERGQWRQTGDKDKGYVLQSRPMTTEEWGEKLSKDIAARPDYYFARVEVPRLDQDLDEYQAELWEIQQLIRDAQKNNRWFRTVNKNTCGFCPYFGICSGGSSFNGTPPEGFELVSDCHPELERTHVNRSTAETTAPSTATASRPQFAEQSYW
ncbi:MAG TPA: PD-(D/E)XK nuclease family protein [Pirellulaceae bacterium]|nr:PD-(D/E)XK nuclease family protein [Pirellulaceae bacterium]